MKKDEQKRFYLMVGKRLTKERKRCNLTIAQLAKLSGEQNRTIRWIEDGNTTSLHQAIWMKAILGIDLYEIISNMEGMSGEAVRGIDDLI